jgi:hypothetical protein
MASDGALPIVTFGKYKGRPVTDMLADTKYVEWCKQQEFFKNHTTIYNICVNQTIGSQPSKTPEHNRMQNLFLDNKRVAQFYTYIYTHQPHIVRYPQCVISYFKLEVENSKHNSAIFEGYYNWDIIFDGGIAYSKHKGTCDHAACNKTCYYDDDMEDYDIPSIHIEIKPLVGDDYPSILRKMKTQIDLTKKKLDQRHEEEIKQEEEEARRSGRREYLLWLRNSCKRKCGMYYLLIKEYQSSTTTKEELIQIFGQSYIHVIFLHDLFPDLSLSLPVKRVTPMEIQMTPSSSSDDRIDILERRVARLESLLAKMGVMDM